MSNGSLTKCPKGHEVYAIEGHPIVDGLPVCPTCLLRAFVSVSHTSNQLNNTVTKLLHELELLKHNGNLYPKLELAKPLPITTSSASTSKEEEAIMLASLESTIKQEEVKNDQSLNQRVVDVLRKYMSPLSFYSGKGIVDTKLEKNGSLIIQDAFRFTITIGNATSANFTIDITREYSAADDDYIVAELTQHLITHTSIKVNANSGNISSLKKGALDQKLLEVISKHMSPLYFYHGKGTVELSANVNGILIINNISDFVIKIHNPTRSDFIINWRKVKDSLTDDEIVAAVTKLFVGIAEAMLTKNKVVISEEAVVLKKHIVLTEKSREHLSK